jgi:hypothetical protein
MGMLPSVLPGDRFPSYKLVAGSQKGNRDLPEKLWANCPSELDSRRV